MELTGREGEVVLLAMARARMISPQTVQKLSSLLYSLPLHSSLKSDYCLLISLDPAAHLHMELHYSCGAWHPIPPREPPAATADRPAGARDRRASPLRPARILSLRPPNRPSQSQRKHLESNLEGGRKEDRQSGRSGRRRRCWKGREGIDPVRPSAPPLKAPPKKSNSQRATFFRSHVNDRRRLARSSLACEWRSRRGDGRTDNGRGLPACSPGCSAPHYTKTNYSDPRKKNVSFKF